MGSGETVAVLGTPPGICSILGVRRRLVGRLGFACRTICQDEFVRADLGHRSRLRRALGLWLPVVAACAVLASCASGHDRPARLAGQAPRGPVAVTTGAELADVSCAAGGYCMAAGIQSTPSGGTRLVIFDGAGTAWRAQTLPSAGALATVWPEQLSCRGANDCMLVGGSPSGTGPYFSALWDGHKWTVAPMPISPTVRLDTDGMSCSSGDRCLEVGESPDTGFFALYWKGDSWVALPPQPMGHSPGADMVNCLSDGSCMVLATPNPSYSVWSGSSWSDVLVVGAPSQVLLQGMDCVQASFCLAVGGRTDTIQAVAIKWDGRTWQPLQVRAGAISLFEHVSCLTENYCMALAQDPRGQLHPRGLEQQHLDPHYLTDRIRPGGPVLFRPTQMRRGRRGRPRTSHR